MSSVLTPWLPIYPCVGIHLKYSILYLKRCLSVPSHYQNWLQIIDIHPRAISQNISKIWWQLLASPVLLGSQWVNPCLPSPMHDWAAEAASWGSWAWPSQLTKDCQPSECTEEHYVSFPGMEHMSVELRKNIWSFIYGTSLNTAKSADQHYSSYSYQS